MNSRRLWDSHQRHKFLRAEASRDILSLGNSIFRGFQEVFSTANAMFFLQNTRKTGINAVRNVPGVSRHRTVRTFHRSV